MTVTDFLKLTYAIRTIDPAGAYSGWSEAQSFWITLDTTPPEPVTNLKATPSNGYVDLFWTGSASSDVVDYLLSYQQEGGGWSPLQSIGNVTNYQVSSLTNGINYTFHIVAEDMSGLRSSAVEISVIPNYAVYCNGIPYDSLSNAVSIAQAGDTITLGAATFILQDTLYLKEGVNLRGTSPHQTILDATDVNIAIQLSGVTSGTKGVISNLTICNAATNGIDASGGYAVNVKNTVIKECDVGIYSDDATDIDIINNTILSNRFAGIYVSGKTVVRNNIMIRNQNGIYWSGTEANLSQLSISYNDLNNTMDYVDCTAGTGDIAKDVMFVDETNNDYRERTGASTVDMGDPADDWSQEPEPNGDRINIGAYGNTPFATKSSPAGSSGGGGGKKFLPCFIATAAYGSPLAKPVVLLRQFRDEYLLTNAIGQWFVYQYYRNSPPLARYIANHSAARWITQITLIPVVVYAYFMVYTGIITKILFIIIIIIGGIWLIKWRRSAHNFRLESSNS
jgi:parallel beta-helix repeat protein